MVSAKCVSAATAATAAQPQNASETDETNDDDGRPRMGGREYKKVTTQKESEAVLDREGGRESSRRKKKSIRYPPRGQGERRKGRDITECVLADFIVWRM